MAGNCAIELSIGRHHLHFDARAEPLSYLNWSYISTTPFPSPLTPRRPTRRQSESDSRLRIHKPDSITVYTSNCPLRPPAMGTSVASLLTSPSVLEVGLCVELGRPVSVPARFLPLADVPTDVRAPSAIARGGATSVSAPGVVLPVIEYHLLTLSTSFLFTHPFPKLDLMLG
jgi:hypothetical protein